MEDNLQKPKIKPSFQINQNQNNAISYHCGIVEKSTNRISFQLPNCRTYHWFDSICTFSNLEIDRQIHSSEAFEFLLLFENFIFDYILSRLTLNVSKCIGCMCSFIKRNTDMSERNDKRCANSLSKLKRNTDREAEEENINVF